MSVHLADFQAIANAIVQHAKQEGKISAHDATIILPGSKMKIKLDHAVKEMVECFEMMPKDEQQAHHKELVDRLVEVRDSPNFRANNKSYAKINLKLTPGLLEKEEAAPFDLAKIQKVMESAKTLQDQVIDDPELNPDETTALLNQNAAKGSPILEEGKFIKKIWDDGKGHTAIESVKRKDTIEDLKQSATRQLNYIETRLKGHLSKEERAVLENQSARLRATIDRCTSSPSTWANSDYFRTILRGDTQLQSSKNPKGIAGAIESWEQKIETEYLTAAPAVNMRYHTCTIGNKTEGVLRLGVISDMSNGFVNLESLQTLKSAFANNNLVEANDLRTAMAKEIISVWKKEMSNKNMDAASGYALKQLGYSLEDITKIKTLLKKGKKVDEALLSITKADLPHIQETLKATILQRTDVMSGQFLQMVTDHAGRLTPEDVASGMMKMLHVSLLSQKTKSVDATGWYHNEENEMLDMAALFDQFDGKKMIADSKGPFIDKEGNLHIPPSKAFPEATVIELRALFVNHAVQGGTKNEGAQRKINMRAARKMRALGLDADGSFSRMLEGDKTSYTTAADFIHQGTRSGLKVSDGCLSAKDRTGFVCALITDRMMRDLGFPKSSRRRILRNQLKRGSPAVSVIRDNTGAFVMKIKPFFIEGITKEENIRHLSIKSIWARTVAYAHQGVQILKEKEKARQSSK